MHPDDEDIHIHITIHQCDSTHYSKWFLGILIYKGILLLFGVFLAWETRNVHYAELNDSKNIGVAVYNILLFSGLSITAEFVLSNYNAKRIFNNSLIHLCTTMVLGLVFLPKVCGQNISVYRFRGCRSVKVHPSSLRRPRFDSRAWNHMWFEFFLVLVARWVSPKFSLCKSQKFKFLYDTWNQRTRNTLPVHVPLLNCYSNYFTISCKGEYLSFSFLSSL